jgi:hypothetical protein
VGILFVIYLIGAVFQVLRLRTGAGRPLRRCLPPDLPARDLDASSTQEKRK